MLVLPDPRLEKPSLFIPRRKPNFPVKINSESSLSKGLLEYYLMNDMYGVRGHAITPGTGGDPYVKPNIGKYGRELRIINTSLSSEAYLDTLVPSSSAMTIIMSFYTTIALTTNAYFWRNNGTASAMLRATSSTKIEFLINPLTSIDRVSHTFSVPLNTQLWIGGSWGGNGTKLKVLSKDPTNGLQITDAASASSGTYTSSTEVINEVNAIDVGIIDLALWDRGLNDVEIEEFIDGQYGAGEIPLLIPA